MMKIPKFLLYGQNNSEIEKSIQPSLGLKRWDEVSSAEKQIAFQELENSGWLESYSREILETIEYLNHTFLRQCPGKHLHSIKPSRDHQGSFGNESERTKAALTDFQHIFINEKNDALVLRMLSKFLSCYIDGYNYQQASKATEQEKKDEYILSAFRQFDGLANCINHIFEQFAVNQVVTRNGIVPRQDQKIINEIYTPTLRVLSDPKWKAVSDDLARMFEDYQDENFAEAITKAHSAVQRFLQILVGEEGKNSKGELSKLFKKAKDGGIIPVNRFTEPVITVIQGFIPSERATNSTAKPATKEATSSDALLMMNVVMILLQHCLQNTNK